jgi:hypothetical protein
MVRPNSSVEQADRIRTALLSRAVIVAPTKALHLSLIVRSVQRITPVLLEFKWKLLRAPKGSYFPTSDNPLFTLGPTKVGQLAYGLGFRRTGVHAFFPLNSQRCLLMTREVIGQEEELAPSETLELITDGVMAHAKRFVYAKQHSRELETAFTAVGARIEYGRDAFIPQESKHVS